ncbi:MAG: glycosyltransferase family 4 protein [Gemmatimonadota bacterium]
MPAAGERPRICILTSVHAALDARIFQKEARALAAAGYDVTVLAQDGIPDSSRDGVRLVGLSRPRSRRRRLLGLWRLYRAARATGAALYTLHDPELLLLAPALRLAGRAPVVYDVHEDVSAQIGMKEWLPRVLRRPAAAGYRLLEWLVRPFLAGVVLAEESYEELYRGWHAVTVRNYALTAALPPPGQPDGRPTLAYVGKIQAQRGLFEMLELVRLLVPTHPDLLLHLIGPVVPESDVRAAGRFLALHGLEAHVRFEGPVSHDRVYGLLAGAHLGLALLHPEPNYLHSLPTKLFEYMGMGVPVVASDFPLWRAIVEGAGCGLVVDPLDPNAAARAVTELLADTGRRRQCGLAGRAAVLQTYSWESQAPALVGFYDQLLRPATSRRTPGTTPPG